MERRFQEKNPENLGVPGKVVLFFRKFPKCFCVHHRTFPKIQTAETRIFIEWKATLYREISWRGDYFRGWLRLFFTGGKGASSYKLVLEKSGSFLSAAATKNTPFSWSLG